MSDQQEQVTVEDEWVNRLAHRIGVLIAQNERLVVENEVLHQQLQQLQQMVIPVMPATNGEYEGATPI